MSKSYNITSKVQAYLLKKRKVLISGPVDSFLAKEVISQLLYLNDKDNKSPILVFINSPGGEVHSGLAIFDMMKTIEAEIKTIVVGLAASMGSILSLGADKGSRYALNNSKFLIHQPLLSGIYRGQASDIEIQAKEMLKTRDQIIRIYVEATGKKYEEVQKDINRDFWLSSEEALKYGSYGLIDKIVEKTSHLC